MGCASSSPLITANGKVLDAAKDVATDAVHAGEEAIHDVKGTLNETVTHVKEAVVEAVHNVGHGIDHVINGKKEKENDVKDVGVLHSENLQVPESDADENCKIIPLKSPSERLIEQAMKEAEDAAEKAKDYKDEAEKLADDLIKETEDVVEDTVEEAKDKIVNTTHKLIHGSPIHSIDSLKTDSPEPEIEKALANDSSTGPPTPKPTLTELEELKSAASSVVSQVMPAGMNSSSQILNLTQNPAADTKGSDDFHMLDDSEASFGPTSMSSEDDFEFNISERGPRQVTAWEELADAIYKTPPDVLQAYRETAHVETTTGTDPIAEHQ